MLIQKDMKRKIEGFVVCENEDLCKISEGLLEMMGKEEISV